MVIGDEHVDVVPNGAKWIQMAIFFQDLIGA